MNNTRVNDILKLEDSVNSSGRGLWAKTEVIGGYGDVIENPFGKSSLGEAVILYLLVVFHMLWNNYSALKIPR